MFLGLYVHRPSLRVFGWHRLHLRRRERQCPVCGGRGIVRTTDLGTVRWSVCPHCGESDQD